MAGIHVQHACMSCGEVKSCSLTNKAVSTLMCRTAGISMGARGSSQGRLVGRPSLVVASHGHITWILLSSITLGLSLEGEDGGRGVGKIKYTVVNNTCKDVIDVLVTILFGITVLAGCDYWGTVQAP